MRQNTDRNYDRKESGEIRGDVRQNENGKSVVTPEDVAVALKVHHMMQILTV